jgi:hypothetical protein
VTSDDHGVGDEHRGQIVALSRSSVAQFGQAGMAGTAGILRYTADKQLAVIS